MAVEEIDIQLFAGLFDQNICVIDVREIDEYESGHVRGAINLPLSEFASRYSELPTDRTLYMICRSGGRSMQACEFCIDAGLVDVRNIAGGTLGWTASGNEVVVGGLPG